MRTFKIAALTLLLVPSAALAAGVSTLSATFTGKTSQRQAVVIHLVQGSAKAPSHLSWSAQCGNLTLTGTARFAGPLAADGSFSPPSVHSIATSHGTKLKLTTTIRFKVMGRVARGTFSGAASYSSGGQPRRCASPKVTFTARR